MTALTGIPVSPGIVWGPAALLVQHTLTLRYAISEAHVPRELARLDAARQVTRQQLDRIHSRVLASAGKDLAYLFQAQMLMLDDQLLVPRAKSAIADGHVNAEWAVQQAFDEFSALFTEVEDGYLQERRGDIADVVGRLQRNLRARRGTASEAWLSLDQPSVLVAAELPPSLAGQLDRQQVIGLALDAGSRTDHTAILARSLRLPAVASLGSLSELVRPGMNVLLDGYSGEVIVEPDEATVERARRQAERKLVALRVTPGLVRPAATTDGVAIRFDANVELSDDLDAAIANGAEGIGLFRSEFMLGGLPVDALDEDAQYGAYRELVERMAPHPVTVRTFDVDASRLAGRGQHDRGSAGPVDASVGALGLRAIRLTLAHPDLFATQLRALVRASRHGALRILFPFVASVGELRQARAALEKARHTVGVDATHPIQVGAMIEVPAAALTVDLLADEVDFFSIGTNDLVQYTLAVDRTDGHVAALYDPLHPAVLRIIRGVVRAAGRRRTPLAVCGEMTSDPAALLALLGLGITSVSMGPAQIPAARFVVSEVAMAEVRRVVGRALRMSTGREVAACLDAAFPALVRRGNGRAAKGGVEGENGEH